MNWKVLEISHLLCNILFLFSVLLFTLFFFLRFLLLLFSTPFYLLISNPFSPLLLIISYYFLIKWHAPDGWYMIKRKGSELCISKIYQYLWNIWMTSNNFHPTCENDPRKNSYFAPVELALAKSVKTSINLFWIAAGSSSY